MESATLLLNGLEAIEGNSGTSILKKCNDVVEASFSSQQSPPNDIEATKSTLTAVGSKLAEALPQDKHAPHLEELLRATKNALRWNLQYLEPNRCYADSLQSKELLTFYMTSLTNVLSADATTTDTTSSYSSTVKNDQVARYATLSLFYATFCATQEAQLLQHVVHDLQYLDTLASVLCTSTNQSVILASLRLLHNLLVSYPKTCDLLMKHSPVEIPGDTHDLVPWLVSSTNSTISLHDLLIALLDYCLLSVSIDDDDDRRIELRTELMRILYVLRAGKTMSTTLLTKLLQFDDEDVRLAAVTLLTDVPTPLPVTENQDALFAILSQQVAKIVEETLVGPQAASTVTPIIIVLRKYCMDNADDCWKTATKQFIFPNDIVLPPPPTDDETTTKKNNNMSPMDAPRGTLRWNCIQLLTWTQGHVKRCMAELLWTLCNEEAQEYMHRVGLGNAMPLLQAKGFMEGNASNAEGTTAMDLHKMMAR